MSGSNASSGATPPPLSRALNSRVLVVDAQTRLAAAIPESNRNRAFQKTGLVLDAAKILGVPITVTEQYPQGLGPTDSAVASHFPEHTPIFSKTTFSCCGAEGMLSTLDSDQGNQIILVGMEAHVCVLQTAFDLQARAFQVFVVEDAVCSRSPANHRNAMERLRQGGIIVTNAESVIFEWLTDASHEHFRQVSALLK